MNSAALKLFLALLWLIPGVGFLCHDVVTGRTIGLPLGEWRLPLAVPCLLLAAFNFVRWWAARSRRPVEVTVAARRRRAATESPAEPDPAFRFDDPPSPTGPKT